jgi:hypothetical protein
MKSIMCSPQSLVSAIMSTLSACGSCLRHFQSKRHVVQSGKTSQDFVDLADRGSELDDRCKDKKRDRPPWWKKSLAARHNSKSYKRRIAFCKIV